jgi:hypothetical protein
MVGIQFIMTGAFSVLSPIMPLLAVNQFPPSRLSARYGVQKRDRRRDPPKRARRADSSRGLLKMKY